MKSKIKEIILSRWNQKVMILCSMICFLCLISCPVYSADLGIENLRQTGKAFASVAKKVSPAVVFIQVEKELSNQSTAETFPPFGDDFFRRFFNIPSPGQQRHIVGQGSGFIVSADGYILTNNHVVGGADKVSVKLQNGQEYKAKIIGTDPHSDVAVIKIDDDNLPVLPLGDSDSLEVGEWVVALGNPFGLSHSLTVGVVSAKGRSNIGLTDYDDFIQTDAAINPGNSGGPLVNLEGRVVGMNTAIFSRSGGYMGIGFAIPINMIKAIKDQLVKTGSVTRGYIGIIIQELTSDLAKAFDLKANKGILISQVTKDSPAEEAGLKQGEIIVAFEGKPVGEVASFRNLIAMKAPGSMVTLGVLSNGKQKNITIKVGQLPEGDPAAGQVQENSLNSLGFTVGPLTRELAAEFGYQEGHGVIVTEVTQGSVAQAAGIKPGTLILEVDRKPVKNMADFSNSLAEASKNGHILMLIKEQQYARYVAFEMEE